MERAGDRSIGIGLAIQLSATACPVGHLMLTPDMEMFDCDVFRKRGCGICGRMACRSSHLRCPMNGMLRFSAPMNFLHWIIDQLAGRKVPTIGPFGLPTFGAILFVSTGRYPGIA